MTPECISILGATGSIGSSTLDVIRLHPERYRVVGLSGVSQLDKLFDLCCEFRPQLVCVAQKDGDNFAQRLYDAGLSTQVLTGQDGLCTLASDDMVDKVVCAIVGAAGLRSTLAAVQAGKIVLLANKESLVMAGSLVMRTAQQMGAVILPIDSEHNAIFQCLPTAVQADSTTIHQSKFGIRQLWLTASGGGFLHASYDEMTKASVADALKHPNWSMGQKITIDSATMMNKGLELIEACHLFNLPANNINIAIHPQSIIHSMVEYTDGSILAQLGTPDMRTPIAYALAYPERIDSGVRPLDLFTMSSLQFIRPDMDKFVCLALAYQAMTLGGGATIILNAANEVAVAAFLAEQIRLTDIARIISASLDDVQLMDYLSADYNNVEMILSLDALARRVAQRHIELMRGLS